MPRASLDNPLCPRCGYDQSGIVATWETECPLDGVCTECGAAMPWAEAFRPELFEQTRYVESREIPFLGGTFFTLLRCVDPLSLWRWVPRTATWSPLRLAGFIVVVLIAASASYLGVATVGAIATGWSVPQRWNDSIEGVLPSILAQPVWSRASSEPLRTAPSLSLALHSAYLLVLLAWARLARRRRVRLRHVCRAWALGLPLLLLLPLSVDMILWIAEFADWLIISGRSTGPWTVRVSRLEPELVEPWFLSAALVLVWLPFFGSYLRVERPLATFLAYLLVAVLATVVFGPLLLTSVGRILPLDWSRLRAFLP